MNDKTKTFTELKKIVKDFVGRRDWDRYHDPKNLSMSIAIETAELMEHYQWLTNEESRHVHEDIEQRKQIEEEVADITIYILSLCNTLNIDLGNAILEKLKKNAEKYPAPPKHTSE